MKKFVIGIGSQRAGSTLLHKILDECSEIFMHPLKELHYYDTLYGVRQQSILKEFSKRQLDRELDKIISSVSHHFIDKRYRCYLRANKILLNKEIADVDYFDLYRPFLAEANILGEITPEYMLLPDSAVARMRTDLGASTKIILIGRDPVDRFLSSFKLLKSYGGGVHDSSALEREVSQAIEEMPAWIEQQKRFNSYDIALNLYKKYFDSVLFMSYEKIISDIHGSHRLLEDFLETKIDLECMKNIMKKKVNSLVETGKVSEGLRAFISTRVIPSRGDE